MRSRKGKIVQKGYGEIKRKICIACNGTGKYDHNNSPKCGSCNGTGFTILG